MERTVSCDVIIPCRDEAATFPRVIRAVPDGFHAIVVDHGSTDNTAAAVPETRSFAAAVAAVNAEPIHDF